MALFNFNTNKEIRFDNNFTSASGKSKIRRKFLCNKSQIKQKTSL